MSTAFDNIAVFPVPSQEEPQEEQRKKDNDGLHKRRGIWHTRVKIDNKWREISLATLNYQEARKNPASKNPRIRRAAEAAGSRNTAI